MLMSLTNTSISLFQGVLVSVHTAIQVTYKSYLVQIPKKDKSDEG